MATFIVTDPNTGKQLKLTGDSPPTEEELEQIFASQPAEATPIEGEFISGRDETPPGSSAGGGIVRARTDAGKAVFENALQMVTGFGGLIASGFTGAAGVVSGALVPGGETGVEKGARFIRGTQEELTFQPRSEAGQQLSENIAKPFEAFENLADTAGEAVLEPLGPEAATFVKTAILAAPLAFGLRKGATVKRKADKPTPRQEVAAMGAEEGYVTPPSMRGDGGAAAVAEGVGGIAKVKQQAIQRNQPVTDKLAKRDLGLPDEITLSVEILEGLRAQAGKAYEAVKGIGQVFTDTKFRRDIAKSVADFKGAAKDFPLLARDKVVNLIESFRIGEFDAASGIAAMKDLRNRANMAYRAGDDALGRSYRNASSALEGVMERHLGRSGDVALFEEFVQARQHIAKTWNVQDALQGRLTGEINASVLAAKVRKGEPLTGDLRLIADYANSFPDATVLFKRAPAKFSVIDAFVATTSAAAAGTAAALGAGPAALIPLAGTIARPGMRRGALSEVGRRRGLPRDRIRPSGEAVLGGALSGVAGGGGF